jgi:hypothetical protein
MNAQEAILKIKALFEENTAAPVEEVKAEPIVEETKVEMSEYSLMDGTKVDISALEIGGSVTMPDGTPAPAGEHQLADGTVMQLDENGIIIEISAKEEDVTTEEEAAPAPEDMRKEADKKMQEMTEAFEAQIAEIKQQKKFLTLRFWIWKIRLSKDLHR